MCRKLAGNQSTPELIGFPFNHYTPAVAHDCNVLRIPEYLSELLVLHAKHGRPNRLIDLPVKPMAPPRFVTGRMSMIKSGLACVHYVLLH